MLTEFIDGVKRTATSFCSDNQINADVMLDDPRSSILSDLKEGHCWCPDVRNSKDLKSEHLVIMLPRLFVVKEMVNTIRPVLINQHVLDIMIKCYDGDQMVYCRNFMLDYVDCRCETQFRSVVVCDQIQIYPVESNDEWPCIKIDFEVEELQTGQTLDLCSLLENELQGLLEQMSQPKETIVNGFIKDYQIIEQIGKGSYGSVQLCKRNTYFFAIKEAIFDSYRDQVLNEIEKYKMLQSPRIVKFVEDFQAGSKIYIVLEYLNLGDLTKIINRYQDSLVPEEIIVQVFFQMVEVLQLMKNNNIIHRDIKPENILISQFDPKTSVIQIKMTDFGISKKLSTMTTSLIGTAYYMAPEAFGVTEGRKFSFQSDVYALGATLYYLANKFPPFYKENQSQQNIMRQIASYQKPLVVPDSYSEELKSLMILITHPDPQQRATIEILSGVSNVNNRLAISSELMDIVGTMQYELSQQYEKPVLTISSKRQPFAALLKAQKPKTLVIECGIEISQAFQNNGCVVAVYLSNFELVGDLYLSKFRQLQVLVVSNIQGDFAIKLQSRYNKISFESSDCKLDIRGVLVTECFVVKGAKWANLLVDSDSFIKHSVDNVFQGIGQMSALQQNIFKKE